MTVLRDVTGDLLAVDVPAIGHGCNCRGSMGGGVAREVRHRFPDLYRAYRARCDSGVLRLGDAWAWQVPGGPLVYSLATQDLPGAHADITALRTAVAAMLADAAARELDVVAVPRLGAGIGGLRWREVRAVLVELAAASPVDLLVVTRARHHDERADEQAVEHEADRDELGALSRAQLLAFADSHGYPCRRDGTHADLVEDLLPYV